jgi:hypothetical protein
MALSLKQFVRQLTRTGLVSADELTAFLNGLPPHRHDAENLARELVLTGRLTQYQA